MDRLCDACLIELKNKMNGFSSLPEISVDVLPVDDIAVSFQYAPSLEPTRYYDRTKQQDTNILIKLKHPQQYECVNAALDLFEYIESLDNLQSENDSFEYISAITYTTPTLIDVTSEGNYIYSGMITISYYMN